MRKLPVFLLILIINCVAINRAMAQESIVLVEAWFDFETYDGGNDKDNDSRIELSYTIKYPQTDISRVFALAPMEAHGRFPDGSSNRVTLKVQGKPTLDDVSKIPGKFSLKFEPKGDDTWKFHYTLRMKFSDGTLLEVKSGRVKELSDQNRSLVE